MPACRALFARRCQHCECAGCENQPPKGVQNGTNVEGGRLGKRRRRTPGGSEPPRRLSGQRCGARCAAKPASATRGVRRTTREARARDRCGGRADDAGELAIPEHRVARDLQRPRGAIGRGLLLYRQRFPPSRCLGANRHELGAEAVDQAKVIRKPRLLSDNASSYISGESLFDEILRLIAQLRAPPAPP